MNHYILRNRLVHRYIAGRTATMRQITLTLVRFASQQRIVAEALRQALAQLLIVGFLPCLHKIVAMFDLESRSALRNLPWAMA